VTWRGGGGGSMLGDIPGVSYAKVTGWVQ
jgi:hypothetical protein